MEFDFDENDTTRTSLGKIIKWIQRYEKRRRMLIAIWVWFKKVLSFSHAEAEKIRLED